MPTYMYQCKECGIVFERFQHFSEAPVKVCPECCGAVQRVIQPVGIIFKGSGFYVTDNNRNSSATTAPKSTDGKPPDRAGEKPAETKPDDKASEKKPEAKPAEAKTENK
jgi:putative FmdB family regulatory protein